MKDLVGLLFGGVLLLVVAIVLAPFAVLWCATLLLAGFVSRRRAGAPESAAPRRSDAATIMILNWNGREFLERLLPSVRAAVEHHGGDHEIVVIDNGSDDDSIAFVEREYPEVQLVRHSQNLKFGRGYNEAWQAATKDIVVLLNNDMVVHEGFLGPLLAGFDDPDTFAVSAQIFLADDAASRCETGLTAGAMHAGVLKLRHEPVAEHIQGLIPVLWAGGGSAAFDRRRLLELGGFDSIYDPFYFEDTGLSYDAWKRGWNVLFAPAARVVHEHEGTSGRLHPGYVGRTKRRNHHLFIWRHLTAIGPTLSSTLLLPFNVARLAIGDHGGTLWHRALLETRAVLATLPRLLPTLTARIRHARRARRSDAEVLALAHSRHLYERGRRTPGDQLDILMLAARVPKQGVDGSWGLFELIRILGQRHRVTLFALTDRQDDERHVATLRPLVHRLEAHEIQREVGLLDVHHRVPARLRRDYSGPELRRRVATLLHAERFDVVQVDYVEMAAMVAELIDGVRSVHVVHEPVFRAEQLLQIGGVFPRIARWLRYCQAVNYEARLYRKFERVVCLSSEDAEHIHRFVPDLPIEVNPVGADVDRIEPCPPSVGHTLLSVGYFGHEPNVDATIWFVTRVLPLIEAEVPDVELRLAGAGATDEVVALAENARVKLLGFVEDLGEEMGGCALALAPVREGGGLRTKVLEAFAYGRTMVVTPIGAAGIRARDGVEYRVARDERAFANAVVELLRDADKRHEMEKAARSLVLAHYTSDMMVHRSEAIYRGLLA